MGEHKVPKQSAAESPPSFPPRAPLKKVELSRNSQANTLRGEAAGFVYQSFSLEPDHPSYIGKKIVRHEIGDSDVGYAVVEPWEVCSAAINEKVAQLDPRTDQGAKIDTTVRYGKQITCRLPEAEFEKYKAVDRARSERRGMDLFKRPDHVGAGGARVTTVNVEDDEGTASWQQKLAQAGVPNMGMDGAQ